MFPENVKHTHAEEVYLSRRALFPYTEVKYLICYSCVKGNVYSMLIYFMTEFS